jgi:hypothetical protein
MPRVLNHSSPRPEDQLDQPDRPEPGRPGLRTHHRLTDPGPDQPGFHLNPEATGAHIASGRVLQGTRVCHILYIFRILSSDQAYFAYFSASARALIIFWKKYKEIFIFPGHVF